MTPSEAVHQRPTLSIPHTRGGDSPPRTRELVKMFAVSHTCVDDSSGFRARGKIPHTRGGRLFITKVMKYESKLFLMRVGVTLFLPVICCSSILFHMHVGGESFATRNSHERKRYSHTRGGDSYHVLGAPTYAYYSPREWG